MDADRDNAERRRLYDLFRDLKFTETEAGRLADANADPRLVAWWLEQGCSHRQAVRIAT